MGVLWGGHGGAGAVGGGTTVMEVRFGVSGSQPFGKGRYSDSAPIEAGYDRCYKSNVSN